MTAIIDARRLEAQVRLDTLNDAIRIARPGTEFDVLLPQDGTDALEELATAPLVCWFSPLRAGCWRFVVRDDAVPGSIAEYLGWDHDRLDGLLAGALKAAEAADWAAAEIDAAAFQTGLLRHIDLEDNQLFPEFENRTGIREGGPTHVMRMEHDEIKEAVAGIMDSVSQKDHDNLMRWHANLLGVLVEHNMKEEQILYPGTDRLMPPSEREALLRRMLLTSGA